MLVKLFTYGGVLLAIYLAFVAVIYLSQSHLVYFPTRTLAATPAAAGLHYEDVELTTPAGVRIHGWYTHAEGARWAVLILHGNGGNISHRIDTLRIFNELGAESLIVDYPGYGLSGGDPDEQGTYDAAMAGWDFLTGRGSGPDTLVIFGRSLGAAVAAWLAERTEPAGVILESAFTSFDDLGRHHYPFLPVSLINRYEYDALAAAARIGTPVLSIHSAQDEIVPIELGRRLHQAFPGRKSFVTIRGGHNDGFLVTGGAYVAHLKQFLDSL